MSTQITDGTLELVQRVIELNCDGELIVAMSATDVARTLEGSGLSESDVEQALTELVRQGELETVEGGYCLTET